MISYETVLMQMEQLIHTAKQAPEQQMREQVAAVRALCNIVLKAPTARSISVETMQQPIQQPSLVTSASTTKLQESDANGDSIFDF